MRKKFILSLAIAMTILLSACGSSSEVPENVKTLQHKIDKALESEPTYDDIAEIKELYDDLLKAEQEMITNYDKIEAMNKIDSNVVSCVFAANKLRDQLKNPNSLEILSAKCYENDGTVAIMIDYNASNDLGGTVEDYYYCLLDTPTEDNGTWSCKLDHLFAGECDLELVNAALGSNSSTSSQETARKAFSKGESSAIEVNPSQIMDNIDMAITELASE